MKTAPVSKAKLAFSKQVGAALIVGLVVLMMLTLLGVSNMNMTSLELRIAGNTQNRNLAFQTADSTIDYVFYSNKVDFTNITAQTITDLPVDSSGIESSAIAVYMAEDDGQSRAKPIDCPGNSLSFSCMAYEIQVTSTHTASNASSTQVQGLVKTGPAMGN